MKALPDADEAKGRGLDQAISSPIETRTPLSRKSIDSTLENFSGYDYYVDISSLAPLSVVFVWLLLLRR